jgi:hypothetical protein
MPASSPDPPVYEAVTLPDQIDPAALRELELLPEERISRCWRTVTGFLVMTNLRCIHVWRKALVFTKGEWRSGPTFLFFDLGPPQVLAGRFVVLTEGTGVDAQTFRFLVRDPQQVCEEIEAARPAGRAAWEARRARTMQELRRPRPPPPAPGTTVVVREIVKVRCRYCGNLMDEAATSCPTCGARQG